MLRIAKNKYWLGGLQCWALEFEMWLHENEIHERFEDNLTPEILTVPEYLSRQAPIHYFSSPFVFSQTPEGKEFWQKHGKNWQEHMDQVSKEVNEWQLQQSVLRFG